MDLALKILEDSYREPYHSAMPLRVLKATQKGKNANQKNMRKRDTGVKNVQAPKKECAKLASPLVRTLGLVSVRNDVARRQVRSCLKKGCYNMMLL